MFKVGGAATSPGEPRKLIKRKAGLWTVMAGAALTAVLAYEWHSRRVAEEEERRMQRTEATFSKLGLVQALDAQTEVEQRLGLAHKAQEGLEDLQVKYGTYDKKTYEMRFERTLQSITDREAELEKAKGQVARAENAYVDACRKCASAAACEQDRKLMEHRETRSSWRYTPCE